MSRDKGGWRREREREAGVQNEFVRMVRAYAGAGCRRRDIDRAGAVIGKTCLSILQSIIERHCHVNGNRIEIAMEMAARRRSLVRSFARAPRLDVVGSSFLD